MYGYRVLKMYHWIYTRFLNNDLPKETILFRSMNGAWKNVYDKSHHKIRELHYKEGESNNQVE